MRFILFGEPIAKKRHRTSKGHTYNPQQLEQKAVKSDIMTQVMVMYPEGNGIVSSEANALSRAGHFRVEFEFHCSPPKSDLWGLKQCSSKKDIDNLCKWILDCCNSILYKDDHQIVYLYAIKCYSPYPKTIINIYPMSDRDISKQEMQVLKQFTPDEMKSFLNDIKEMAQYDADELDLLSRAEIEDWCTEVSILQYNFAHKWAAKLAKVVKK